MTLLLLPLLLLKSLLVFALAGLLLLALRRASAAARALVCLLTLGAVLLLPLFSLTLPGWHLPVLKTQEADPISHQEPTPPRSSATLPKREGEEFQASQSPASPPPAPRPPVSGGPLRSEERTQQGGGYFFYLLGLLLAAVRPLLGLWGIRRLSQTCVDITDTPTLALAESCAGLLGLRLPRLCRAGVPVPLTWGWRRPVVALPPASADWPDARLRSVLLHEMAHVKRCDWPAHRLADFACAVLWFHPFVWLTARRLRSETELACDDLVLASGIPAADYARHLLEIASALPRVPSRSHAAIAMAQTSHIESRLHMILDKTRTRRTLTRRVLLFSSTIAAAALVPLAMLRPIAKAQTVPQPALMIQGVFELVGVRDVNVHHTDKRWWGVNGQVLPGAAYNTEPFQVSKDLFSSTNVQNLCFVFRSSEDLPGDRAIFISSGALVSYTSQRKAQWNVTASFPLTAKTTNITVGTAAGPWMDFATLSYHRGQHIPFEIYTPGRSGPDLDVTNNNRIVFSVPAQYEFRVVAVSMEGQETTLSQGIAVKGGSREKVTVTLPPFHPRLRSIHIESCSCAWQVFSGIALQPSASPTPRMEGPAAAVKRLHRIYGFIQTYRKQNDGAFPQVESDDLARDMTAQPEAYGLPDSYRSNYNQVMHFFTSSDSRFMDGGSKIDNLIAYIVHGKRPDETLVGTAKRRGTRDVLASTSLYVRSHPEGDTGFYLVLWDDGRVEQVPANRALLVPSYDSYDPAIMSSAAARRYWKQIAFPGQAGLPQS